MLQPNASSIKTKDRSTATRSRLFDGDLMYNSLAGAVDAVMDLTNLLFNTPSKGSGPSSINMDETVGGFAFGVGGGKHERLITEFNKASLK